MISDLNDFLRDCLAEDEESAVVVVDLCFAKIAVRPGIDAKRFRELIESSEKGEFQEINPARLAVGPSYIELGAWLGDQTQALIFMAVGEALGFWKVITPMSLGVTDREKIGQMAGVGYVMTSGYNPPKETE